MTKKTRQQLQHKQSGKATSVSALSKQASLKNAVIIKNPVSKSQQRVDHFKQHLKNQIRNAV